MRENFRTVDRDTEYLLPPSMNDWLPEGHLARFIVEIVNQLDLSGLNRAYRGRGHKAYDPKMMIAFLFYGYATGTFSSRKLENASYDSVAFRYITADQHPDHDTIAHFRKRFLGELDGLFVQILQIAGQSGVLKVGTVSLDGTKIKANASKHKAMSYAHANRIERLLKEEVQELLRKAEEADEAEVPDGMDIPEELKIRKNRLEAIARAKAEIERRAAERDEQEQAEYEKKLAQRAQKEKETGKKPGGKIPKTPEKGPRDKDQMNLTDSESRIMPDNGGYSQCYNAQASVDTDTMLVVGSHLTQNPNDKQEIVPAIESLHALPEELGAARNLLADTGYYSEQNVNRCVSNGITPYISTKREKHHKSLKERFAEDSEQREPEDAVDEMRQRLKTKAGRRIYAKRKSTVETVFGNIKSTLGFRQFSLRGMKNVQGEWTLVCMAWNLKRLYGLAR